MKVKIFIFAIYIFAVISIVFCSAGVFASSTVFTDSENCLYCHRYPTLGKYDKNGEKKIFYVNGEEYASSVHGRLQCTACHLGLDRIPHTDVRKVDCSMKCHIHDSPFKKGFSHRDVAEKYEASVHGSSGKDEMNYFPEDLPTCTYCHNNHRNYLYNDDETSAKSLSALRHPESKLRSQMEVIELCASCHEDREKMMHHGLESIRTYKDTFHWQALKYGFANAPDCISCHVPLGYSSHTIRPNSDPLSPVNSANRVKTCSKGGGIQTCHPDATEGFARGRIHTYGIKAQLLTGESDFDMESRFKALMMKKAKMNIPEEEIFHFRILSLIRLVYRILIGCTIGFMSVHQLLDYIRARKKHKESH